MFKNKTMQGKRTLPGVEEAVAGGAAVAWLAYGGSGRCCGGSNGGERDFSAILCFRFVFSGFLLVFFCFRFQFLCFWFVPALPSLSCVISLLTLSSGSLLSFGLSPFIGEKTKQVCLLLVRLQSRNGWSASDPFGGLVGLRWGRGERGGKV